MFNLEFVRWHLLAFCGNILISWYEIQYISMSFPPHRFSYILRFFDKWAFSFVRLAD